MNHYTLAEMTPGLSESFTVTITEEMMARFEAITGDVSPIHMDAEYAQKRGYPGRDAERVIHAVQTQTFAQQRAVDRHRPQHRQRQRQRRARGKKSIECRIEQRDKA